MSRIGIGFAVWVLSTSAQALQLTHGDVISLRSSAAASGKIWFDCNTKTGQVGLVDSNSYERYSGTHWRVHDNEDGSFSLECLGNMPGRRWLRITGATVDLGSGIDRKQAAHWNVAGDIAAPVGLQNTARDLRFVWLNSFPASGITGLSDLSSADQPGTRWQVEIHSRSDASKEGRWSMLRDLAESAIHTHVLPNGKVLYWSRFYDPKDVNSTLEGVPIDGASTFLLDPVSGDVETLPNAHMDAFCSGHSFLPDGRLLVTGGHMMSNVGPKTTQIFDYRTLSWEHRDEWDMNAGRWYPTNLTLSTGEVLTLSGDATSAEDVNRIPQVWRTEGGWRDLSNLASMCFNDGKAPCMPLYPWAHMAPNGKAFVSGPGQLTGYIDAKDKGTWEMIAKTAHGYRGDYEATSTMYAPGKILIAGGLPTTNSVEVIDLNQQQPQWRTVPALKYPRHKLTSTILADGTVLVNGGTARDENVDDFSVYASEIWDPETETWTEGDHMRVPRLYHSTAVLLPDGRVLSMGGGLGAGYTTHKNLQIYSPPYLFKGPRPQMIGSRSKVHYGETLRVDTRDAVRIRKVHMIKLSSDTHSFNSNQLIVPLPFHPVDSGLELAIPTNPSVATPGHYFLFIVDEQGVPSVGSLVHLL